jgi:hypothetical protein
MQEKRSTSSEQKSCNLKAFIVFLLAADVGLRQKLQLSDSEKGASKLASSGKNTRLLARYGNFATCPLSRVFAFVTHNQVNLLPEAGVVDFSSTGVFLIDHPGTNIGDCPLCRSSCTREPRNLKEFRLTHTARSLFLLGRICPTTAF